jgi:hypothetical protein
MESDLAALWGLKGQALQRISAMLPRLVEPEQAWDGVERLRLREFFSENISSQEDVEAGLIRLRERLYELLGIGVKIVLE